MFTNIFYIRREILNFHSVSYIIPPFTTITGLIFSMLGIKRENYDKFLDKNVLLIGIKINNIFYNLRYSLKQFKNHEAFSYQLSKKKAIYTNKKTPIYEIYLYTNEEDIYNRLFNKEINFIPYLGSSSFLLKLKIDEINVREVNKINKISKNVVYSKDYSKYLSFDELQKENVLVDVVPLKRKENEPIEIKKEVFVLF